MSKIQTNKGRILNINAIALDINECSKSETTETSEMIKQTMKIYVKQK